MNTKEARECITPKPRDATNGKRPKGEIIQRRTDRIPKGARDLGGAHKSGNNGTWLVDLAFGYDINNILRE